MNTIGKWLVRAGALLLSLGFVLPSLTVSCTLAPGLGRSYSLANLASNPYISMPLLYLVPLGSLAMLVFSFLPADNRSTAVQYLIGQLSGLVVILLSLAISLLTLSSQVGSNQGFQTTPKFGIFILLIGYILCAIGLYLQWQEANQTFPTSGALDFREAAVSPSSQIPPYGPSPPAEPALPNAHLEVVQGNLPFSMIPIYSDNFTIGRSSSNDLQIRDESVSRQHARIRYAQNAWFIQDCVSKGGTFVNGRQVSATRLNLGDRITIGDTTLVFRL